jgi:hypothetical protein
MSWFAKLFAPKLTYGVVMMQFRGNRWAPACPDCRHTVVKVGDEWFCKNHRRCFCIHRCHPPLED